MPDLNFTIEGATALRFAVSPHIAFSLAVRNATDEPIHSVILQCQIHLDATYRKYSDAERGSLTDLFGKPEDWGRTLRGMLWTHISVVIPSFEHTTTVAVHVPCSFDFNVAATKYFQGLEGGDVPLTFFFTGSVFYTNEHGVVQAARISWEKEAGYRLPVRVWLDMMDLYYPNTRWLCLQRDAFDRLYKYKVKHGIPTFEQTLEAVIE